MRHRPKTWPGKDARFDAKLGAVMGGMAGAVAIGGIWLLAVNQPLFGWLATVSAMLIAVLANSASNSVRDMPRPSMPKPRKDR